MAAASSEPKKKAFATGAGDLLVGVSEEEEVVERNGDDSSSRKPDGRRHGHHRSEMGSLSDVRYRRKSLEGDYNCSICYELLARPVVLSTSGLTACESCIALLLVHHWQQGKEGAPDPLLGADNPTGLITKLPPVCAQLHSFLGKRFPDEYAGRLEEVEQHADMVATAKNHDNRTKKMLLEKAATEYFDQLTEEFIVNSSPPPPHQQHHQHLHFELSPFDALRSGLWKFARLGIRAAVAGSLSFAKKTRGVMDERERAAARRHPKSRLGLALTALLGHALPLALMVYLLTEIGQLRLDYKTGAQGKGARNMEDLATVVKGGHFNVFLPAFVLTGDYSAVWRLYLSSNMRGTLYYLPLTDAAIKELVAYQPLYRRILAPMSRLRMLADADAVHVVMVCLYLAREAVAFASFIGHFIYYRVQYARRKPRSTAFSVLRETLWFLVVLMTLLELYNLYRFMEGLAIGLASFALICQTPILRELYFYAYRAGFEVMVLMNLQLLDGIIIDPRKDRRIIRALSDPRQGAPFGGIWQAALGRNMLPFLDNVDVLTALAMVHRFTSRPLVFFYN